MLLLLLLLLLLIMINIIVIILLIIRARAGLLLPLGAGSVLRFRAPAFRVLALPHMRCSLGGKESVVPRGLDPWTLRFIGRMP